MEEQKKTQLPDNAHRELKPGEEYQPLLSPQKNYPEVTPYSVGMGLLMTVIFSAAAAFLGAFFDSMLGSLLQIKYKCQVCGELTEKDFHCKKRTKKHSGFEFFDNDVVNLASGLFAAILGIVIYTII
jgi:uncharacterized membrane protein